MTNKESNKKQQERKKRFIMSTLNKNMERRLSGFVYGIVALP